MRYIVVSRETSDRERYDLAVVQENSFVCTIEDVTPKLEQAIALAELLENNRVPVEHFRDVVEDYIAVM